ncbi:MAG: ATP-binding cassette domain-containing protein [Candidatus Nealsonbacteria bacterium]|nr:MAG: ATP-binding cassette domain-containing protein [Candidatus Nealsonbacteria bacterium]
MKNILLKVEKLWVKGNEKEILKGINFQIKKGEIQALLGPNASGKSTLAQVILGNPKYKISQGRIFFHGREINKILPEKRVKLGIALAWQSPPAVKGVKLSQLLEKISQRELKIPDGRELLGREVNLDFSGGEKKISELIQILALNPKLVIFDEIDSGLDIKKLEKVAKIIKKELIDKNISVLLITHWGQILNFLKPDITNVILDGKIICRSKDYKKVIKTIKKYGYEKCKKCPFFAN